MGKFSPNSSENDSNSAARRRVRKGPVGGAGVSFKTVAKNSVADRRRRPYTMEPKK